MQNDALVSDAGLQLCRDLLGDRSKDWRPSIGPGGVCVFMAVYVRSLVVTVG